jgi:hypothetical protein
VKTTVAFAVAAVLAAALPAQAQYPYYDRQGRPEPYNAAPPWIADQYHSYQQNVPERYRYQGYPEQQQQQGQQQYGVGPRQDDWQRWQGR